MHISENGQCPAYYRYTRVESLIIIDLYEIKMVEVYTFADHSSRKF